MPITQVTKAKTALKRSLAKPLVIIEEMTVPKPYLDWIDSLNFNSSLIIFEDESPFVLFDKNELKSEVEIDGLTLPAYKMLNAYSQTLIEFMGDHTYDQNDEEFSLHTLGNCIAIGYENTRILFFDPFNENKLGVFHPDGGDIHWTPHSLDDIIRESFCC